MTSTTNAEPTLLEIYCPHCGSDRIATEDLVYTSSRVRFELTAEGRVEEQFEGSSVTHWDSQFTADDATPYKCMDCDEPLCLYDLAPEHAPPRLPPQVRADVISSLEADLIRTGFSTADLESIAKDGFKPFTERADTELLDRYAALHGEQEMPELAGDDEALAKAIAAIRESES